MKVWVLQYSDYMTLEIIGIYSSKEKVIQVMEKKGWKDNDHYIIDEWDLDKTYA